MEKFSLSRSIKAVNAMYECASLSMTKRMGLATARKVKRRDNQRKEKKKLQCRLTVTHSLAVAGCWMHDSIAAISKKSKR